MHILAPVIFLAISAVQAHYIFSAITMDDDWGYAWKYVRTVTTYSPVKDIRSPEFRCHDSKNYPPPNTATIAAGSTVKIWAGGSHGQGIDHQGPMNIYMAKAPDGVDVANWDGAGKVWFKIYEISARFANGSVSWPTFALSRINIPLPKALPSGQYIFRIEHIDLEDAISPGGAEFYIACAQLGVTDGGTGTPGPLVEIPGVYDGTEPGLKLNIYFPTLTSYVTPGPPVWPQAQ